MAQVLRGGLWLARMGRVAIHLRVRRMLAYMVCGYARGGRRLLVLGHDGLLRLRCLYCDECASLAATVAGRLIVSKARAGSL